MIFVTIVAFLLIFSLLILIHEFGHFIAAKKSGVKVEEFGFGLPPRIWGIKKGETLYSINWIPFGGFVRMLDAREGGVAAKLSNRSFDKQSLRKQALIICAGVIMNFLLAFVLLTIGFLIGIEPLIASEEDFLDGVRSGQIVVESTTPSDEEGFYLPRLVYLQDENSIFNGLLEDGDVIMKVNGEEVLNEDDFYEALAVGVDGTDLEVYRDINVEEIHLDRTFGSSVIVGGVESGSNAEAAGLQVGDIIKSVGEHPISSADQVVNYTSDYHVDGQIAYEVLRDGETLFMEIPLNSVWKIGIIVSELLPAYDDFSLYLNYTPHHLIEMQKSKYAWSAPVVALKEMYRLGKLSAVMFVNVFANFLSGGSVPAGVAGPIGIAQMTFVNIQSGFAAIIRFVALLSLSLGVVNILPIPALDGGRMAFIVYQAITGRKPNPHIENWIHTAGFFLLILFLVYVTFNDVLNFF